MGPEELKEFNPNIVTPVLNNTGLTSVELSVLAKIAMKTEDIEDFSIKEKETSIYQSWSKSYFNDEGLAAVAALSFQFSYRSDDRAAAHLINCLKGQAGQNDNFRFTTEVIGLESSANLALLDKVVAKSFIKTYCQELSTESREWLYVIAGLKRSYGEVNDDFGDLKCPIKGSRDYQYCNALIRILVKNDAGDNLSKRLRDQLSLQITPERIETLDSIEMNIKGKMFGRGLHEWSESIIKPKPGFFEKALKDLSTLSKHELLSCYQCLVLQKLDNPKEENQIIDLIIPTVSAYSSETTLLALKQLLANSGQAKEMDAIDNRLITDIKEIKLEHLSYIMTRLMVYDCEIPEEFEIKEPQSEEDKNACQRIIDIAHSAPMLWDMVRKPVGSLGPQEELYKSLIFAGSYFTTVAEALSSQVNEESRLWLYLAVTMRSENEVFRLMNTEELIDNTAIRNQHVSDANTTFIRLAKSSPILKEMISRALIQKDEPSDEYLEAVKSLPLYIRQHIKEKISRLTPQSQVWLYQAITLNMRLTQSINIGDEMVIPPKDVQEKLVSTILDDIYYNPTLKEHFKDVLEHSLAKKQRQHINFIRENYIKLTIKNLNPDELCWLYANTLSLNVNESVEAYFGKSFKIRPPMKTMLAKTLFVASQDYYLIEFLQEQLLALNPNIANDVIKSSYELGPLTLWEQTPEEIACASASHIEIARSMIPLLLAKMSQFDAIWLTKNLASSDINFSTHTVIANPMLQHMGYSADEIPDIITPLLLISLKYPELRKEILRMIVKDYEHAPLPEINSLNLDGLELGDKGFALLANAITRNTYPLELLSLEETGITSKNIELLAPLIKNAPLDLLNLDQEMLIKGGASKLEAISQGSERIIPLLIASILNKMNDPFGWGYLSIACNIENLVEKNNLNPHQAERLSRACRSTDLFHLTNHEQLPLIDMLARNLVSHTPLSFRENIFELRVPPELIQIQMAMIGLQLDIPQFMLKVLKESHDSAPELINHWFKECLKTKTLGMLDIEDKKYIELINSENGANVIIGAGLTAALLNALIPRFKEQVAEIFDIDATKIKSFRCVDLANHEFPDFIQKMIALSLSTSNDVKYLNLAQATFNDGFQCLSTSSALLNLGSLNLSHMEINARNVQSIIQSLEKMEHLSELDISFCQFDSDKTFSALLEGLQSIPLKTLVFQGDPNGNGLTLTKSKTDALQQYLSNPDNPLQRLDLSHQHPNPIAFRQCLISLQSNSTLKELCLNHMITTPKSFNLILELVRNNQCLRKLEVKGHRAGLKGLEALLEAAKTNFSLSEIGAKPFEGDNAENIDVEFKEHARLLIDKIKLILLRNQVSELEIEDVFENTPPQPLRFSTPATNEDSYIDDVIKELNKIQFKK